MEGQWEYTWVHLAVSADSISANHKYQGDTSSKPNESLEKFLQRLGDDRWEMVGVLSLAIPAGPVLFFKRPKQ